MMSEVWRGPWERAYTLARFFGMLGVNPVAYTARVEGGAPTGDAVLYVPTNDAAWVRRGLALSGLVEPDPSHLN